MMASANEHRGINQESQEITGLNASAEEGRTIIKETYEDTRMVMRGLISGLTPRAQSDLGFIEKTAMMMQRMDASRTAELSRLGEEEKQLTSQVKRLQHEHAQQTARHRALGYQQKMAELQKESVELAKELSELETNANWASGELGKLRGELAALETRDVAQELPVGAEVIQVQLYKQAGFQYTSRGDLLIHSPHDAHVVPISSHKSGFERTNEIWQLATGPTQEDEP